MDGHSSLHLLHHSKRASRYNLLLRSNMSQYKQIQNCLEDLVFWIPGIAQHSRIPVKKQNSGFSQCFEIALVIIVKEIVDNLEFDERKPVS